MTQMRNGVTGRGNTAAGHSTKLLKLYIIASFRRLSSRLSSTSAARLYATGARHISDRQVPAARLRHAATRVAWPAAAQPRRATALPGNAGGAASGRAI